MNQTNLNDTLDVLNDLLQINKDGKAGFQACAEDLYGSQLKAAMLEWGRDYAAAASELERTILESGGRPEDSTSFAGDLHRRWVDLKSLVTGKDEEAVLNECECSEDVAKQRYQAAPEKLLPVEIHQVIECQYQGVPRHYDRVRALRGVHARGPVPQGEYHEAIPGLAARRPGTAFIAGLRVSINRGDRPSS